MSLESYRYSNVEGWDKHYSPPPVFDLETARRARLCTDGWLGTKDYPALTCALTLATYNYILSRKNSKEGVPTSTLLVNSSANSHEPDLTVFLDRFSPLAIKEMDASKISNPLPTIGIEIEIPDKPLRFYNDLGKLIPFMNTVGLPRNRANATRPEKGNLIFWEYSTNPSYNASVQARILSELIRGGFIASLTPEIVEYDRDSVQDNIFWHLSESLVSLHINLGFPLRSLYRINSDANLLGRALALAFTSPKRLEHRKMRVYTSYKEADSTLKIPWHHQRLEMKALEVATSKVYRNIKEAQLLGAALLADLTKGNPELVRFWRKVRDGIESIFTEFGVDIDENNNENKAVIAYLVRESDISRTLRTLFTANAIEISHAIALSNP